MTISERMNEIRAEIIDIQSGDNCMVDAEALASEIAHSRPELRGSEQWSAYVAMVRLASRFLSTRYQGPAPTPIGPEKRRREVEAAVNGDRKESAPPAMLSVDAPQTLSPYRVQDIVDELEASLRGRPRTPRASEAAVGEAMRRQATRDGMTQRRIEDVTAEMLSLQGPGPRIRRGKPTAQQAALAILDAGDTDMSADRIRQVTEELCRAAGIR